jgi:tetratricopeptide (TPR) repeat protein
LGYIEYNPESFAIDAISRKVLISKIKEVNGDGVVIVDKKTRASGIYDFMGGAHISYSTDYWMAVVKYLETGAEKLLNQGIALLKEGQYDRAIAIFDEALEINPRYALAYNFRGIAYDEKGQYDKAISDYNKAIELNPTYAWAYENRGIAYDKKGHFDEAISDYNKAIELNPKSDAAYHNRGDAHFKKNEYDKAISDYTKVIEINPGAANAYLYRGVSYFYKKEYEKAWDDVHKAQNLGLQVHPEILKALRDASGRQE